MAQHQQPFAGRTSRGLLAAVIAVAALSACGGGGGGMVASSTPVTPSATQAPAGPTPAPTAQPQMIKLALPGGSAIGQETDPTFGMIGGYTQTTYSQVLAFAPGSQVMIVNAQPATSGIAHTLNVLSQSSFPASGPASGTASGGTTLGANFASGILNAGTQIGPITLTAGTYYIGCFFHYASNTMRDVLMVAANATPGPQATPVPQDTPQPIQFGY
jgi:hypothetical protein